MASVAWLGYDSPTGPASGFFNSDTYRNEEAFEGGASLARMLDGIRAVNPGAHTTVAGHSYGAVVVGQAAVRHGLKVDDLVLTGSPGAGPGADHASDLNDGGETRVWAARARDDQIAAPLVTDGSSAVDDIHGSDPTAPDFGAERFRTGPPLGEYIGTDTVDVPGVGEVPFPTGVDPGYYIDQHTDAYSDPDTEAFRNLVRIATGDRGAVTPGP